MRKDLALPLPTPSDEQPRQDLELLVIPGQEEMAAMNEFMFMVGLAQQVQATRFYASDPNTIDGECIDLDRPRLK